MKKTKSKPIDWLPEGGISIPASKDVNAMDEKVNRLMELLEPCLKREKGKYKTASGDKTEEGLRGSIKAVLEEE